jgi:hypothetical protein
MTDWRGWKYNGVAELGGETYALIEQQEKKRSHFLKKGDRLEDARVMEIRPKELVLREETGGVARVQRVDAMAELLRSSRSRSRSSPAPAARPPAGTAGPPAPAAPPIPGRAAPFAGSTEGSQQSVPVFAPEGAERQREGRRRRFQATTGEESGTNAIPDVSP